MTLQDVLAQVIRFRDKRAAKGDLANAWYWSQKARRIETAIQAGDLCCA